MKVFRGTDGTLLAEFFAYGPDFRDGVNVAARERHGLVEVSTSLGGHGGPHARTFRVRAGVVELVQDMGPHTEGEHPLPGPWQPIVAQGQATSPAPMRQAARDATVR